MSSNSFLGGHGWKKFVNVAYNLGAAVVIIGAMFKILHLPHGDLIIGIGMLSEAVLFTITAIDPVGFDYKWERVFPELVAGQGKDPSLPQGYANPEKDTAEPLSEKMDKLLSDAGIDARLMQNLASGMDNLSRTARNLSNAGEFGLSAGKYSSEIGMAAKNMESLNQLYGMQIENMARQVEDTRSAAGSMSAAAEASRRIQGQMQSLSDNLASLNSIYGGVLSAMGGRRA